MSDLYFISQSKLVIELIPIIINFSDMLLLGESINPEDITVYSTVITGVDPSPTNILYGLPNLIDNIITQNVNQGIPGVIYELSFNVTTNLGNTYRKFTDLAILPMEGNITPSFQPTYLTSSIYPYYFQDTYKANTPVLVSGILEVINIVYSCIPERYKSQAIFIGGTYQSQNIIYPNWIPEQYKAGIPQFLGGTYQLVNVVYSNWIPEQYKTNAAFLGGSLIIGNVVYSTYVPEQYKTSAMFLGGTLTL